MDLDQRPILVFWETTKACGLSCRHCRASAISQPLQGELTTAEAARFVESLAGFDRAYRRALPLDVTLDFSFEVRKDPQRRAQHRIL